MRSIPVKLVCLAVLVALPCATEAQIAPRPAVPSAQAAELERIAPTELSPPPAAQRPVAGVRKSATVAPNLTIKRLNAIHVTPALLQAVADQRYLKAAGDALAANLKNHSVGYAVAVVMPDGATTTRTAGSARRAPDSAARAMLATDKLTIARSRK